MSPKSKKARMATTTQVADKEVTLTVNTVDSLESLIAVAAERGSDKEKTFTRLKEMCRQDKYREIVAATVVVLHEVPKYPVLAHISFQLADAIASMEDRG